MVNLAFCLEARDVVRKCFTEYCIMDEIALHLVGDDLVQLSRTSKWLQFSMWGFPSIWKRALERAGIGIDVSFAPFHTIYTLSILSFTIDCMLCGASTRNGILGSGKSATRLCNTCASHVLMPAPTVDQPPEFMQTFYHGGPHRFFKLVLRHDPISLHAKRPAPYEVSPRSSNRSRGNRYQQKMNKKTQGPQPRFPIHSLTITTIGRDYIALLPLSGGN
ncbi:hypothetical protein RSOLAG1IB_08939 [Rhizoctonia solani AG-1 IB]|uniref:Uncharacterized protein n=1 Tax=Thanatephorus cucumeris (strain AG1-IB / isolate 7/3/14) TaxID=1108050 RepID=A0A0B7FRQ8_THACB|nr:hypothetical protein RSOLAG1IB_08939 [Rhizoctonia solani AG-1 IB]